MLFLVLILHHYMGLTSTLGEKPTDPSQAIGVNIRHRRKKGCRRRMLYKIGFFLKFTTSPSKNAVKRLHGEQNVVKSERISKIYNI